MYNAVLFCLRAMARPSADSAPLLTCGWGRCSTCGFGHMHSHPCMHAWVPHTYLAHPCVAIRFFFRGSRGHRSKKQERELHAPWAESGTEAHRHLEWTEIARLEAAPGEKRALGGRRWSMSELFKATSGSLFFYLFFIFYFLPCHRPHRLCRGHVA